jgi:hypothetical protein
MDGEARHNGDRHRVLSVQLAMRKEQMECRIKSISHTERELLQLHCYSRKPLQRPSLSAALYNSNERASKDKEIV